MLQNNALTTLVMLKQYLNISDTTQDSILEIMINAASEKIENYCNRKFGKSAYIEKYGGTGDTGLIIKNYPVSSVSSVKLDGTLLDSEKYAVLNIHGILFNSNKWPSGERNIEVSYEAGYVLPKDATEQNPRTLPNALEVACFMLAKMLLEDTLLKESERIGDYSVVYTKQKDLPPVIVSLISPYVGRVV